MKKTNNYLFLLVILVVFVAVFAGFLIYNSPSGLASANPSGSFALGTCNELNQLFMQNNCYGPGDYDGYTCMKIVEAKQQRGC